MDKKQIMKMNDTWKNFRLTESAKIFSPGFQHGFDLTDFKPGGFKKVLKSLGIPATAKGSHTGGSDFSNGFYFRNKDMAFQNISKMQCFQAAKTQKQLFV